MPVLGSLFVLAAFLAIGAPAHATTYTCSMDGPSEFPVNASPGTGSGIVEIDAAAHTMHTQCSFSGLIGNTTASHLHGPTASPGVMNAGVMTTTPSFTGFPLGVTFGTYDHLYDLTLASSYNPSFVTANGGTVAGAEAALLAAIGAGKAYWNIHSSAFPGGEIRGFLLAATSASKVSWGRIKSLYR
jgi:hypothetical protein